MNGWFKMLIIALLVPFAMTIIGLITAKWPPKRINRICGYRTSRSMKSQAAWDFANVLSGKVWQLLGVILLIVNTVAMLFVMRQSEQVAFVLGMSLCAFSMVAMIASIFIVEYKLARQFDDKENETPK